MQHEMNWTCDFIMHKSEEWRRLGDLTKDKVGHQVYAAQQCKMYKHLYQDAMDAFNKSKDPTNIKAMLSKVE